mmetsp:Transcript_1936/g.3836  ORF Transcript_1936/g.3836 Transcript_1936/m.3836 type:complete len:81 (-) Transcript_1936:505-747(-)
MESEVCTVLNIEITEVDENAMRCKEGVCAGIKQLKLSSKVYNTQYAQECDVKNDSNHNHRFYFEPAQAAMILKVRQLKNW